jgi:preprotein translocase subunit SecE
MAVAKDKVQKMNLVTNTRQFFVEVAQEMKKIVWPSREVLIQSTATVLVITLVLTVYMGLADIILRSLYNAFNAL